MRLVAFLAIACILALAAACSFRSGGTPDTGVTSQEINPVDRKDQTLGQRPNARPTIAEGQPSLDRAKVAGGQPTDATTSDGPPYPPPGVPGPSSQNGVSTRREPDFNTEAYTHLPENDFLAVADNPLSTFSIDVDTASYANVRRFLRGGSLPPKDAVRIEEFVNYFTYDYPDPKPGQPFAVTTEVMQCPWNQSNRIVQVALHTRRLDTANAPPCNLVFLLDVSGSMQDAGKLPLVKQGMRSLVAQMRPQDKVSIVVYAGSSGLVLPPTPGTARKTIEEAIERLEAGGSTNGGEGIVLAYRTAKQAFVQNGVNRVILATDGDFNVGVTSEGELVRLIEEKRKSGVYLTVLGFGTGNYNDATMEKLADHGNGNYAYIDSIEEARKVLVREAGATLVTVAKDVKLQLEFNPSRVASYRLIGYENRVMAAQDFNNDRKDAGEIGAGHVVTALYEVVPATAPKTGEPLQYQTQRTPIASDDLLTVKVRFKRPTHAASELLAFPVVDRVLTLAQASTNIRFAAAVASFGMLLRDSSFAGNATFDTVLSLARDAMGEDPYRTEFVQLVETAKRLKPAVGAKGREG